MTTHVSLEFFPPSTARGKHSLERELAALAVLRPEFVSVTCGAGGSTRRLTRETLRRVRERSGVETAPHVICVDASRTEVKGVVADYVAMGVRHVVALRGDAPRGAGPFSPHRQGYTWATELVADIAQMGVPQISVAAYPEVHPEARSPQADLDNLKRKIDAGATRAITQFFFDADVFLRFRDRARRAGIDIPIVPGILPVNDFRRAREFADRCGASIPTSLAERFTNLEGQPDESARVAAQTGADMCVKLLESGVRGLHFYTMNRSALTLSICEAAGLLPSADAAQHG
jgi:methylenetetrahydrofolate reductase (NADPH)